MTEQEALAYILDSRPGVPTLSERVIYALRSHAEWANSPRSLVTPDREVRTYRGKVAIIDPIPGQQGPAINLGHNGVWDLQGLAMEAGASWEQVQAGQVGVIVTLSYRADGG